METLQPIPDVQVEPVGEKQEIPAELMDAGLTLKAIETISYLGLQDQMFDTDIIEKVDVINSYLGEEDIMELDVKLGNPYDLNKLDNMYSYVQLENQSQMIRQKEELINKQKRKYGTI